MRGRDFEPNKYDSRPVRATNPQTVNEPTPELLEQFYQYQKAKRHRGWRISGTVLFGLLLVAFASWQTIGYYQRRQLSNQIPVAIRQDVDFPVYLPTSSEFRPDPQSFDYSSGVLLFQAKLVGTQLTIAEQKKTPEFDLSKFSTAQGLTDTKQLSIDGSSALLGKVRGHNIAIVDTGKTIVTITSTSTQPTETLELIVRSLQKV
jgi:hypothetical protein